YIRQLLGSRWRISSTRPRLLVDTAFAVISMSGNGGFVMLIGDLRQHELCQISGSQLFNLFAVDGDGDQVAKRNWLPGWSPSRDAVQTQLDLNAVCFSEEDIDILAQDLPYLWSFVWTISKKNPHVYASRPCLAAQRATGTASVFIGTSRRIAT